MNKKEKSFSEEALFDEALDAVSGGFPGIIAGTPSSGSEIPQTPVGSDPKQKMDQPILQPPQ